MGLSSACFDGEALIEVLTPPVLARGLQTWVWVMEPDRWLRFKMLGLLDFLTIGRGEAVPPGGAVTELLNLVLVGLAMEQYLADPESATPRTIEDLVVKWPCRVVRDRRNPKTGESENPKN